jgi:hypothetical protein
LDLLLGVLEIAPGLEIKAIVYCLDAGGFDFQQFRLEMATVVFALTCTIYTTIYTQ